MIETLTGFAVVVLAVVVGYILGRSDVLGPHAARVLARLTFYVLAPFLLFVVLSQANTELLFSSLLPVSALAAIFVMLVYLLVAKLLWRRSASEAVIGALATGFVNSNNIGLPLSLYLLGSAAYPAPVILFQVLILTPISLFLLEATAGNRVSLARIVRRSLTNPIVLSSILGVLVSLSGLPLPALALEPATLLADACVPVLLISYGLSLSGQRLLGDVDRRSDVVLATVLKLLVMPVAAWVLAGPMLGLPDAEVFIVVVLAALPSAQNVFNYAQNYGVGVGVARDTILLTTIGCLPVLLVANLLLS
ncbi:AEC family transporter [Microbacterium sp. A93]|uniref:AEC family transporter n=1 Tax=Microbacterium sp. A93 TaxID=3450716 RepID=UPI003F42421A